jgi:hypothetical protein
MLDVSTDKVWLVLLEVTHPDMATVRFCRNSEPVVHDGETYLPRAFAVSLPADSGDKLDRVTLQLDVVEDASLRAIVRGIVTKPSVIMKVVLFDDPDNVQAGPFRLNITSRSSFRGMLTLELTYEDRLNRKFPAKRMSPRFFPGLYS